jgi:MFS family permease
MMPVLRDPSASRRIVAVLLLLMPVSQVTLDAYTPALPQIVDELHSSNQFMQNTVTAFMLGITVAVLPVGLISDALGRKRIVLAGLALMVLTSIGCALVESLIAPYERQRRRDDERSIWDPRWPSTYPFTPRALAQGRVYRRPGSTSAARSTTSHRAAFTLPRKRRAPSPQQAVDAPTA